MEPCNLSPIILLGLTVAGWKTVALGWRQLAQLSFSTCAGSVFDRVGRERGILGKDREAKIEEFSHF